MNATYKNYSKAAKLCREYFKSEKERTLSLIAQERAKGDAANVDYIARCEEHLAAPYHNRPRKGSLLAWQAKEEKKLEETKNAGRLVSVDIRVEWTKSRIWGNIPHAEVYVSFVGSDGYSSKMSTGRASGCGYDKQSAAVSSALSGFPEVARFVIECGGKTWNEYAVERSPFPQLSFSGKGMSTLRSFFLAAGWKWTEDHGKRFDVYHATKKEVR